MLKYYYNGLSKRSARGQMINVIDLKQNESMLTSYLS